MNWKDLTINNIEQIKELYTGYLKVSKSENTLSFEDFLEILEQCPICGEYVISADMYDSKNKEVCVNCYGNE